MTRQSMVRRLSGRERRVVVGLGGSWLLGTVVDLSSMAYKGLGATVEMAVGGGEVRDVSGR
jgi:hypothetical protein